MDEKNKLNDKFRMMKGYVDYLKQHRNISLKELQENYTLRSSIERNLHLSIESSLDIGEVIIASRGYEKPKEYKDIILILGKKGVLPEKFAEKFAPVAGFRNILVHRYGEVDIKKLHRFLHENLEDFDKFSKYIVKKYRK